MNHQVLYTRMLIGKAILLLLVLWAIAAPRAVAMPWTAGIPPQGPVAQPYPVIRSPFRSMPDREMVEVMAPPELTLPFPGGTAGGCCAPPIPWPLEPTNAWPPGYPSPVVVDDDPTRWVACLNAQNAARLSRLFEIAGAPGNVMELPGTRDPCSELNPEPMGWTPDWNHPNPRPAYISREGHVLDTLHDWGGPR